VVNFPENYSFPRKVKGLEGIIFKEGIPILKLNLSIGIYRIGKFPLRIKGKLPNKRNC